MAERLECLETNRRLFIQASSHELKNPITSIKGITSLIHMKLNAGKPVSDIIRMVEILEKEVDRLSKLLIEILEAFMTERNGMVLKTSFRKINITEVIQNVLKPLMAAESGYNFIFKTGGEDNIYILADPDRIGDVMRNLYNNAMKYSPRGSDIITRVQLLKDSVQVSVEDRGIGIPEDQTDRIFDSFYRGSNIRGNDPGGMGLGLYICREIVKKHGGSIWAENNADGGSKFYIKLPLCKEV